MGCFTYSPVEGAPANALADPVPEAVKQERQAQLMALQAAISAKRLQGKIGRTLTVLVDGVDEAGTVIARSTADAPEIDGVVYVENGGKLPVGEFAEVQIHAADEHDLYAETVGSRSPKRKPRRKSGVALK